MILYVYILKEHILPFIYSIGVITFIFIMDLVIQLLDSILSKGLSPGIIIEVFLLNLSWMIALSVPMAFLVSTLMAFGRLSADNEITALNSLGLNPYKMITPPLVCAIIVGAGMIFFNDSILPESNHKARMLMTSISRKKPAAFIKAQTIISDFKGYKIFIDKLNPKTSKFKTIRIYEENKDASPTTTYAKKGKIEYVSNSDYLQLTLIDGETHKQDKEDPSKYMIIKFHKQIINIKNTEHKFTRTKNSNRGDREMNIAMMRNRVNKKMVKRNMTQNCVLNIIKPHYAFLSHKTYSDSLNISGNLDLDYIDTRDIKTVIKKQKKIISKLRSYNKNYKYQTKYIDRFLVEIYKKYSIPAACVVFVLIGVPLGVQARTSGIGIGISFSIIFFILYWAFLIGGETLADKNIVSPFWAMWAPNFLIGGIGIILIFNMAKEKTFSPIKRIKKILGKPLKKTI